MVLAIPPAARPGGSHDRHVTVLARISIPLPFTPVPVRSARLGALSVGMTSARVEALRPSLRAHAILENVPCPGLHRHERWLGLRLLHILGYSVAAIAGLAAQRGADCRILSPLPTAVSLFSAVYILGLRLRSPSRT